jgi:GNAT superfamily N-acetyltransferase
MALRPRREADLGDCVRLLADVHRVNGYPTYWPDDPAGWLSPKRLLSAWVAQEASRIVGHVALAAVTPGPAADTWSAAAGVPPAALASVSRLFVEHQARGAGVGGALLDAACADAARRGLHPVLDVVETNRDAMRLYERRGWWRVHSEPWADARDERLTIHYYVSEHPSGGTAPPHRLRRTRAG